MMSRPFRIAFATLVLVLANAGVAAAYPQWQFSSGTTRCNVCHFSPSGGGLPTNFGRDADGDELSTFPGEGMFLHGAIEMPRWLAAGADFRGAFTAHDAGDINGTQRAAFPMQADVELHVAPGWGFSAYAVGGLRGQARANGDIVPTQNYQPITNSQLISREHWLMWQPGPQGWYARAGRFFAPFGLRLAEHIVYIRRDLGFDQLQESYNLSGGYLSDDWELHATAFAPDVLRHIGADQGGGAVYYERRVLNQTGSFGLQGRYATGKGSSSFTGGGLGKYYVSAARTLLLAEADLVHKVLGGGTAVEQFVGVAGASVLPFRGVMITLLGEHSQQDLSVANAGWQAATALFGWFPVPHAELQVMGRLQFADGGKTAKTFFLQGHYFL